VSAFLCDFCETLAHFAVKALTAKIAKYFRKERKDEPLDNCYAETNLCMRRNKSASTVTPSAIRGPGREK
jgi:hypothetical protein